MTHDRSRSSPADTAALLTIIILIITIIVLLGIYFLRQNGMLRFENSSAEATQPHVIISESVVDTAAETTHTAAAETSAPITVTTVPSSVTTVTETTETDLPADGSNPAKPVPSEYDKGFFDNIFMVGDSISVGLVNYGYLKAENVFAQVGLTPASVMTTLINEESVYDKAAACDPDCICIMLGTNGLSYLSEDYMAEKMGEFIDALREKCPNSKIAVLSIPPVTEEHEKEKPENLTNISNYNEHIKKVADDRSALFVDIFPLLQGSTGYLADDFAENDGLHFKGAAYPVVLSAVQTAITETYPEILQTEAQTAASAATAPTAFEETSLQSETAALPIQ